LNPEKLGEAKVAAGAFARAADMKSCQIKAGIVPPKTAGKPSTFVSGISPFG
jgi:hypothetical protein